MNSDLQTQDFGGFEKPSEHGVPAAGEELKSGTPTVTRPQRPLALPMMALQLGSRPLDSSGRWVQSFLPDTPIVVFQRALARWI
ncbi:hypothetical protein C2S51_029197 [Perilla frutescens var. frutescens]|nr:hypothetical protein C2S51_029197 [Perilla frutescens var. frutescens]